MRRILPIALLLIAAGCFPFRRTIFYRSSGEPSRAADLPESVVFDLCRQWIAPVPDAAQGWCFRLSVRPELVRPGSEIAVPSEGARPLLSVIAAPGMKKSREVAGTVRVVRVEPHRIMAEVDLEERRVSGGWRLRRPVWFRRSAEPPDDAP
jgi:hypothetical protein